MIALYILLVLALLITFLCLIKIQFTAVYENELTLKLRVLFFEYTLVPFEKKSKKRKKKREKKILKKKKDEDGTKEKKTKKPSYLKQLSDKKGVEGLISMLTEIVKLIGTTLKGIFTNIVIKHFDLKLTVVGDDAADTALKYGKLCGVVYSAVSVICSTAKCEDYNVNVIPDFDDEAKMKVFADAKFYIRVFYVLKYALKALFKLFVIRYKR
ncbi:MAG: DUF2953 domain-containing protein [Ruminococcus sp.]|nr:DUF2953 domain-containing protein [Ruminococcus sp.]